MKKLSDYDVVHIREKRQSGITLKILAKDYSVDKSTISLIARGKRRSSAGGPIEGVDYLPVGPTKWHWIRALMRQAAEEREEP